MAAQGTNTSPILTNFPWVGDTDWMRLAGTPDEPITGLGVRAVIFVPTPTYGPVDALTAQALDSLGLAGERGAWVADRLLNDETPRFVRDDGADLSIMVREGDDVPVVGPIRSMKDTSTLILIGNHSGGVYLSEFPVSGGDFWQLLDEHPATGSMDRRRLASWAHPVFPDEFQGALFSQVSRITTLSPPDSRPLQLSRWNLRQRRTLSTLQKMGHGRAVREQATGGNQKRIMVGHARRAHRLHALAQYAILASEWAWSVAGDTLESYSMPRNHQINLNKTLQEVGEGLLRAWDGSRELDRIMLDGIEPELAEVVNDRRKRLDEYLSAAEASMVSIIRYAAALEDVGYHQVAAERDDAERARIERKRESITMWDARFGDLVSTENIARGREAARGLDEVATMAESVSESVRLRGEVMREFAQAATRTLEGGMPR